MVVDTIPYLNKAVTDGKTVLVEGAQSNVLDIDFGGFLYWFTISFCISINHHLSFVHEFFFPFCDSGVESFNPDIFLEDHNMTSVVLAEMSKLKWGVFQLKCSRINPVIGKITLGILKLVERLCFKVGNLLKEKLRGFVLIVICSTVVTVQQFHFKDRNWQSLK